MKTAILGILTGLLLALTWTTWAESPNPNTDWFSQAKYGVFMHFLPSGDAGPEAGRAVRREGAGATNWKRWGPGTSC